MKQIKATEAQKGMMLINIGIIDSVQITPQHVRIVCRIHSLVLSAAFFWYMKEETLIVSE